jgi:hypothetical protein
MYMPLIVSISMFSLYLLTGQFLYLAICVIGILYILTKIFETNEYDKKILYIFFSTILLIQFIILAFIYIFRTIYLQDTLSYVIFIIVATGSIYSVIYLIYRKDFKIK